MTQQIDISSLFKEIFIFCFRAPLIATCIVFLLHPIYLILFDTIVLPMQFPPVVFVTLGTILVHEILYFGCNTFFYLCDLNGWLHRYKMPRTPRMALSDNLFSATIIDAIIGHFIFQPIALYVLFYYLCPSDSLLLKPESPLGTPLSVYLQLLGANFTNEFFFYFIHRSMHEIPFLYRTIHKQHHQYIGTIGFASEYAHLIEQILANDLPTFGFCFFYGVHPLIWFVFLFWRLEETYETHSGYCFRQTWLGRLGFLNGKQAEFHDFHHTHNTGNYGHHLMDRIFGTMGELWDRQTTQISFSSKSIDFNHHNNTLCCEIKNE
jgi:sterol desaturase/sphingolipid hydroxylase (fatty acid hydroxylase superfamily)